MLGKIRKLAILGISLCIVVPFYITVLANEDPNFQLIMDSLALLKGVSTELILSVENAQGAQITDIEGLNDFDVLSTKRSTSQSIINGEVSSREDFHLTIMPLDTGEFSIKAIIRYNNQVIETNTLQITVSEGSADESTETPDLFITTTLSHNESYIGEKVVATYELFSRYNIYNFGFTDHIAIDGMMLREISQDEPNASYVYLNGNKYAKYEVVQVILDPINPGDFTIPSFNFQVNVVTGSGFFGSSTPLFLLTDEKTLTVNPLPTEGRPNDFSGIVGELQLDSDFSRTELNYGDSLSLNIKARGNVNLDGLRNIITRAVPNFSDYEVLKGTVESVENNSYHIEKAFDVILVPQKTGVLNIEPMSLSYFNPITSSYEVAQLPGATIQVLGDMPLANMDTGVQPLRAETVRIAQVNYANANSDYYTIQLNREMMNGILIGVAIFIVLTVGFLWLIINRKKHDPQLRSLYKQLMGSKDVNEIYNLFNAMVKHHFNLSLKASSQSVVRNSLPDGDLGVQITGIMDYVESAKVQEENSHMYIKDKIKGIYKVMSRVSPQVQEPYEKIKHVNAPHLT